MRALFLCLVLGGCADPFQGIGSFEVNLVRLKLEGLQR